MSRLPFPLTHVLELRVVHPPASDPSYQSFDQSLRTSAYANFRGFDTSEGFSASRPVDEGAPLDADALGDSDVSQTVVGDRQYTISTDTVVKPASEAISGPGTDVNLFARLAGAPPDEQPSPVAHEDKLFALPLPPVTIEYTDRPADAVSRTQWSTVIEEAGLRRTDVRVTGTFGQRHVLGTDREGSPRSWAGQRLHAELVAFLHAFWKHGAPSTAQSHSYELIWRDFADNRHLRVVLSPLQTAQDESFRTFRRYVFQLEGYETADPAPSSWVEDRFGKVLSFTRDVADAIDTASTWVDIARANLEEVANLATEALEPLRALDRLAQSLQDVAAVVRAGKEVGRQAIRAALDIRDSVLVGLDQLGTALGLATGDSAELRDALEATEQAVDALELAYTTQRLQAASSDESSYVVRAGDTLESISAAMYGSTRWWPLLADANELQSPYISRSGLPHTVAPGDRIVLPAARNRARVRDTFPAGEGAAEERLFGVDLAADETGWRADGEGTDVRLARGVATVKQGLMVRTRTERGSNRLFPDLGLPQLIGQPDAPNAAAVALAYLLEQINADDRVSGADQPAASLDGATLRLGLTVRLRGEQAALPLDVQVTA